MTESTEGNKLAKDKDKPARFPLLRWLMVGLVLFFGWGALAAGWWSMSGQRHDVLGAWGDSFAPLTGIASTLAMLFAAWAVHEQKEQLKLQREELGLQRDELKLTREEMAEQRKEMTAQRQAQERSAKHQEEANRIAYLSNAVALHSAHIAALRVGAEHAIEARELVEQLSDLWGEIVSDE